MWLRMRSNLLPPPAKNCCEKLAKWGENGCRWWWQEKGGWWETIWGMPRLLWLARKNTPRASNSLCSVSLYLEAGLQTHTHMINYLHTSYSHSYIIKGRPTHDHTHDHMTKWPPPSHFEPLWSVTRKFDPRSFLQHHNKWFKAVLKKMAEGLQRKSLSSFSGAFFCYTIPENCGFSSYPI